MKSINADDTTKPIDKIPRTNENNKYKGLIEQELQK